MTQVRFNVDDYVLRVLDIVKGKFGLKNRNEALNRFFSECGQEYLEPIPNPLVLKELDAEYESYKKKYKKRTMTKDELRKLMGID